MLNIKNTTDGYLKDVEIKGNTIQDASNLADIRSVGDKVEGQELYEIPVVSCGKNLFNEDTIIHNKIINTTTGIETASNEYHISNFIKINPNTRYIRSLGGGIFYYDKDFNFISMIDQTKNSPLNAMYCKLQLVNTWDLNAFQFEEGTVATPYEPYVEDKLTILSPVQLEKVGDVADRIICKDGVWGVEKNCLWFNDYIQDINYVNHINDFLRIGFPKPSYFEKPTSANMDDFEYICNLVPFSDWRKVDANSEEGMFVAYGADVIVLVIKYDRIGTTDKNTIIQYINNNFKCLFKAKDTQFIPLPHDQQVKLRTFAGQTNIHFETEIEPTIKAQVPKSLGATVNTHTEQIGNLSKELDRVKKLEESTVSTVTTESDFTTVTETANGYFEDVKLEGKTLVNKLNKGSWKRYGNNSTLTTNGDITRLERTVADGNVCYMALPLQNKFELNTEYTIVIPHYNGNLNYASIYDRKNGFTIQVGMIKFTGNVGKLRTRNDISTLSDNIELLFYTGNTVGSYLEISSNILLLEGDHTQNPPSFFEGLMSAGQDVDEVSVESVNENLFDGELEYGAYSDKDGNKIDSTGVIRSSNYIYVKGVKQLSIVGTETSSGLYRIFTYDKNKKFLNKFIASKTECFTINNNVEYITFHNNTDGVLDIDVMVSVNRSEYTPYQSNKKPLLYYNNETQTWEKPILRQWDSIEKHSDGKYYYHKRSGEVVLNGSEDWKLNNRQPANTELIGFYVSISGKSYSSTLISNQFINPQTAEVEGIRSTDMNSNLLVSINRSKLSTQDVQGLKQWLQANPTTVVYQLAQEEVYECTNIDLITYDGETNFIVNCGAISPKSTLKVHNNISNVVKILQEKVSLLESNVKASQEVQDMMILETDMRMLDIELALMEFMPIKLNLGGSDMLRSATYFNFLKNHIINETYEKEYLENVMNKYLATGRINQDEYDELYKLLYPPVYDIALPIEE